MFFRLYHLGLPGCIHFCKRARRLQDKLRRCSVNPAVRRVVFCGGTAGGALYGASIVGPPDNRPKAATGFEFGSPLRRVTDVLLVSNCILFLLQKVSQDILTFWGAKITSLIMAGQVWRLVTPGFLHNSWIHLAVNMYTLHSIGPHMEVVGGRERFLAVYLLSTVAGIAASTVFSPKVVSVGASCAMFGLCGAMALYYWRHRDVLGERSQNVLTSLGKTLALNMVLALFVQRMDNWGHLGGLVGGVVAAWLVGPRFVPSQDGNRLYVDKPPVSLLAFPNPRRFDLV